ncbi:MAG TPA: FG-GAP-like repeat-containing protein, partial [Solirubrobacteraceae bacterium]
DFDGDTHQDLAVADLNQQPYLWLGDGAGGFEFGGFLDGPRGSEIQAGDVNGDGRLDLVVTGVLTSQVWVLPATGDGTFGPAVGYPVTSRPEALAIADLDGDGDLDLAVSSVDYNTLAVLLGNGDGSFQLRKDFLNGPGSYAVIADDADGDGNLDLITASLLDGIWIRHGDGGGGFAEDVQVVALPGGAGALIPGDFDGDGATDYLTVSMAAGEIALAASDHPATITGHVLSGARGVPGIDLRLAGPDGQTIASTRTDAEGAYSFTPRGAGTGDYVVRVDDAALAPGGALSRATGAASRTVAFDGHAVAGVDLAFTGPTRFAPGDDADGDGWIDADDRCPHAADPEQADRDADGRGDACDPLRVRGLVWDDADADGAREAGEAGVPGALVHVVDGDGHAVAEARTGADGRYDVEVPAPWASAYAARVDDPDGARPTTDATPPARPIAAHDELAFDFGYAFDADGDGVLDRADNCPRTANADQGDADGDGAGDACDPRPYLLGGRVWSDEDRDGLQDAGERGVADVGLTVDGEPARTAADGRYAVQVAAGRHAVTVLADGPLATARSTTGGHSRTVTVADANMLGADFGELLDHAPDCTGARADIPVLWPPDKKLVAVWLTGATDADGDALTWRIDSVAQDEPVAAGAPDAARTARGDTVWLRADHDPKGDGRVYRIAFTVADGYGGSCAGAAGVVVPRHGNENWALDSGLRWDSFGATGRLG